MATLYRDWTEYAINDVLGVGISDVTVKATGGEGATAWDTMKVVSRAGGPAGRALELKTFGTGYQLFFGFKAATLPASGTGQIYVEYESEAANKLAFVGGPLSHFPAAGTAFNGITGGFRASGGSTVVSSVQTWSAGAASIRANGSSFAATIDVWCILYNWSTSGSVLTTQMKYWKRDSESEPGAWAVTTTADTFVGSEGLAGFARGISNPESSWIHAIGIGTGGDAAPRSAPASATSISLTGPASGASSEASTNFTVTANAAVIGAVTVTPATNGTGTFSPATPVIANATTSITFTFTPTSTGAHSITLTNNGGLTNPSAHTYTVSAADTTAPTFSVSPAVGSITESGGTASATIDEIGDIFYVVVPQGDTDPTPSEVFAGQASGGGAPLDSGSVSATTSISDAFSGLTAETPYKAAFIARDDAPTPNQQATVTIVNFSTTAALSNDIRLQLGMYTEGGGRVGALTELRYVVFSDDLASIVASGSALTTDATGVAYVDVNSSPWVAGDYAPVLIASYNSGDAPADRTVKAMFGFIPAIAQP